MIRLSELKLPLSALPAQNRRASDAPLETEDDRQAPYPQPLDALRALAAQVLGVSVHDIGELQVFKRSFDARGADVVAVYIVDLALSSPEQEAAVLERHAGHAHIHPSPDMDYRPVAQAPEGFGAREGERPVVVGFGPCGMMAALVLAQMGFKPIVLERGKTVRERTKDTWDLWRRQQLHTESNVQFGEGGAGTFSDGKLYSQIKDPRFLARKLMHEFVRCGAPAEILFEAHPHIGTFKLVKVVEGIREQIQALGGEIRFQHRVVDALLNKERETFSIQALEVENMANGERYQLPARHVVMALGHSSRDTFAMLWERGVAMQAKPFSVGVRVEHPQSLIDRARWGRHAGHPLLGAADYKLVHHARNGRGVYSFCMCPGGTVVAATSEAGRVVTNGMSQYSRAERNANAALVVGIEPQDYPQDEAAFVHAWGEELGLRLAAQARELRAQDPQAVHPLAGVNLQRALESRAYVLGGSNYRAPAQRVGDFLAQRASSAQGEVVPSYQPGVHWCNLADALPDYATEALREAIPAFARRIRGFDLPDAVLTGVETRTSSPIKIPRGEDLQCSNVRGLYPAGEGASYAGGILSAGVDGIKVAQALALDISAQHSLA